MILDPEGIVIGAASGFASLLQDAGPQLPRRREQFRRTGHATIALYEDDPEATERVLCALHHHPDRFVTENGNDDAHAGPHPELDRLLIDARDQLHMLMQAAPSHLRAANGCYVMAQFNRLLDPYDEDLVFEGDENKEYEESEPSDGVEER
ncbi:hypothetical protein PG995_013934 [Apiospora arundinis]